MTTQFDDARPTLGPDGQMLTAHAEVATHDPARYARQLLSHLGHRVMFTTARTVSIAQFGAGTGRIEVADGRLVLGAQAPDQPSLDRVQEVLGRHLERFGQRRPHRQLAADITTGGARRPY